LGLTRASANITASQDGAALYRLNENIFVGGLKGRAVGGSVVGPT